MHTNDGEKRVRDQNATMTTMELKSISCKGVKSGIPFQKPSLYAVVSVARAGDRPDRKHNQRPEQKKTPVDRTGGENPEWDRPMQLDVDGRREHDLLLEFDVKSHGIFGDRVVGKVRVPVSGLDVTAGALRQVSYQVRSPDGKPNGVLSFFYKMGDLTSMATAPPPAPGLGTLYPPPPSTTAPPADVYPPPPSSTVSDLGCYPTPDPAVAYPPVESGFGYFSMPDPVGFTSIPWSAAEYCYPPPDMGYVYPTGGGGYYPPPPPPPPPVNVVVYPPPPLPAPACCYPAPLVPNWYRAEEGWDRGLYGCN